MIGAGLVATGVAATVVLALTIGSALIGVALVIGGVALILGARWMPARTRRGSVLVHQVRGLLSYLRSADPKSIPDTDRALVIARSLPYAVVLGDTEHWLSMAGNQHWYEGNAANLPRLITALSERLR
jgi:hypothetical protein